MELDQFPPMLLAERPLNLAEPGWIYEIKYDGYRLTAMFGDGKCRLRSRNGADATGWFPEVAKSLARIAGGPYVTDGEVCVFDDIGRSDFNRLQDRARRRRWYEGCDLVGYAVFDLLVDHGIDITKYTLLQRKTLLAELLDPTPDNVLVVGHFEEEIPRIFKDAVLGLELEGLVAKRMDSVYVPGVRSSEWVKVKRKGAIPPERFKR
ncbi:RNA ligase family protein [Variovorax sp. J22P271]|uniref:ATP-dependent DNA ligase n=1 Tax=Variovorax davisae TaxID=3053515 RepID=UPI0025761C41|nr:RNA ligase family protein [Variovorax sp. J22P271]MDM0036834.1 RNA ligase family protein [Variovorax sp. J22P271]